MFNRENVDRVFIFLQSIRTRWRQELDSRNSYCTTILCNWTRRKKIRFFRAIFSRVFNVFTFRCYNTYSMFLKKKFFFIVIAVLGSSLIFIFSGSFRRWRPRWFIVFSRSALSVSCACRARGPERRKFDYINVCSFISLPLEIHYVFSISFSPMYDRVY